MNRGQFVQWSLVAFALVFASFLVLGFGRLALPYRTARLLAAPVLLAAAVLVAVLLVHAVLVAVGVRDLD